MPKNESRTPKALVVEDQALFREAVADELRFFGFVPVTAQDGKEGLDAAISTDFDLILSDIKMPVKDGRWFLNELRKTRKCAPPFIFMTGFTDLAPQDAYEMGADGFLGKPLDSDKLAALLAKVCRPFETRWSDPPKLTPTQSIVKDFSSLNPETAQSKVVLGRGGMFLAMEQTPLKPGEIISFDIQLPDPALKRLTGIGTILWRRDQEDAGNSAGYGIDFEHIYPATRSDWVAYLRAREIVPVIPKGRYSGQKMKNENNDLS